MPPVIGITPSPSFDDLPHGSFRRYVLPDAYVQAVAAAGGTPLILPLLPDRVADDLQRVDGVLLSGGADVDPARYGDSDRHPATYGVDDERDAFELNLVLAALETDVPVLAICRGIQVLNVALGGTLIQDIPSLPSGGDIGHRQQEAGLTPEAIGHQVTLSPSWPLSSPPSAAMNSLGVNSFHHQAIDRLGNRLEAVAVAPDGLVEAVVVPDHPFALGVQWHPELMYHRHSVHREPFRALVAAAEARTLAASAPGGTQLR